MRFLPLAVLLALIAGCSNQSIYESIQINQRSQCVEKQGKKYFDCVDKTKKSYEDYREALEELKDDS